MKGFFSSKQAVFLAKLWRLTPLELDTGSQSRGPAPPLPTRDERPGAGSGQSGERTYLSQLPVVNQFRPVSVDQGTEAKAVLPAARGGTMGGKLVSGAKHSLRGKC